MITARQILEYNIIRYNPDTKKPIETLETSYALIQDQYEDILVAMEEYAEQVKPVWISVKERLPERGTDVLAVDNTAGMNGRQSYYEIVEYIGEDEINTWKTIGYHWETQIIEADYYTHWMPLPEPPKD